MDVLKFLIDLSVLSSTSDLFPTSVGPVTRDNYKFTEMNGHKPLKTILSLNLVGHPIHYIREITYKWSEI